MGCPDCWKTFGDALGGLLIKVQHEATHVGRAPVGVAPVGQMRHRLEIARAEMEVAIGAEDFEGAARLRDEIAQLELQLRNS